jgi:methionine--tRNA ligase beta chain
LDLNPYYLLGGYSPSCTAIDGSGVNSLAMASISSFMSLADTIRRSSKGEDVISLLVNLDSILDCSAFLVQAASPTLADLDVFFSLIASIKRDDGGVLTESINSLTNVKRWMRACSSRIQKLLQCALHTGAKRNASLPKIDLPSLNIFEQTNSVPLFFYHGEKEEEQTNSIESQPSKGKAANKNTTKEKEEQGETAKAPSSSALSDEQKQAAVEKRAKKAAEKAAKKKETSGSTTTADSDKPKSGGGGDSSDFNISALDIRVGKILNVKPHESADKLFVEEIDLGEDKPRQIISGLRHFYKQEELQDRMVLVLCNLKERNLVGMKSHGMVLCASNAEHTSVELVVPPNDVKVGERVMFEGYTGEPEAENKVAKKKILEKLGPDLKTDDNGIVVWKNAKSSTSLGPCVASKGMKNGSVS